MGDHASDAFGYVANTSTDWTPGTNNTDSAATFGGVYGADWGSAVPFTPDRLTYSINPPHSVREASVQLKSTQYGVIALNGSTVVSVHDSEAEASSAAGRLAAKDGNEYLVIKPLKIVRQKPVDIEEVTV